MSMPPRIHLRPGFLRPAIVILAAIILATPLLATAQDSTPSSPDGTVDGNPLASLLSLVPQEIDGLVGPDDFDVYYSNFSAQLDAVGLEPPDSIDDERFNGWHHEVGKFMLPPNDPVALLQYWREDYGFDLLQADQTLQAGIAPHSFTLYRGRFDEQAILTALDQIGYEPVGTGEPTILSIRDDYAPDLDAPTAYKLAQMNFGTILDDGTLVFAPALGIIESVVDIARGEAPSFAERPEIAALLAAAPPDLASAFFIDGTHLSGGDIVEELVTMEGTPDIDALATTVAEEAESRRQMPPIRHVLIGVTPGWSPSPSSEEAEAPDGAPTARNIAIAFMYREDDAQAAVPVIEERLSTETVPQSETPFIEMYPEWTVEAVTGEPLVVVDLVIGEQTSPRLIYNLLVSRGLSFLAW